MNIRKVNTRNGEKFLENLDATEALWNVLKTNKPGYLSVSKHRGAWSFAVWGDSVLEVRNNLADLQERLRAAGPPPTQRIATQPRRWRRGDAYECAACTELGRVCQSCIGCYDDE